LLLNDLTAPRTSPRTREPMGLNQIRSLKPMCFCTDMKFFGYFEFQSCGMACSVMGHRLDFILVFNNNNLKL